MTVTQRTLLQIAATAGFVIFAASGVTYYLVYREAEKQVLAHLSDYVMERARQEETTFRHTKENLELVRGQFEKANTAGPVAGNYQQQWDYYFERYPDGAWRSRKEFSDGRKWSTLWAGKDIPLTPELMTQILRANNICNAALAGWVDTFPSVYFVFPQQANVGFDPRIPNWVWDTKADYDNNAIDAVKAANMANNPDRKMIWNGVEAEPTSGLPYISIMLPIDIDGAHVATLGHDIHAMQLLADSTRSNLTDVSHFIFRDDGRLIAHQGMMNRILASAGKLSMQECGEPGMSRIYEAAMAHRERHFSGQDGRSGLHYAVSRLEGPEWFYVSTIPMARLRAQAFGSSQWVLWSGLLLLGLTLPLLAIILRKQIAVPLEELSRVTLQMSKGDMTARAEISRKDELGQLADAFNEMAGHVEARDATLRQFNQDLEQRVADRTQELTEANQRLEVASEEAIRSLAREKEAGEMKSRFVTTVSHEFRNPLAIILSCSDVLERFDGQLSPEDRGRQLHGIQQSVRRMADMMEEVLVLGRAEAGRLMCEPEEMELEAFCRRLVNQAQSATADKCVIHLHCGPLPGPAMADQSLLQHILTNLLSNAVKYSPAGSGVDFSVSASGADAIFRIADQGTGIPEEDLGKLFEPFHRGSNVASTQGTGLGLAIVKRCVEIHGGKISCVSASGLGSTFTVTLPLFARDEETQPQSET